MMEFISPTQLTALGQVVLACMLGGVIGFERETRGKPAGLKTHSFVAGSSALFVILSTTITKIYQAELGSEVVNVDPIRVFQAIIIGVSFIGAGTIIKEEEKISGLTTAASLLMVVAIGIAVALRSYFLAIGVTVLTLLALRLLRIVDLKTRRRMSR